MTAKLRKYCRDCIQEVREGAPAQQANRPAPYPGPRCHSHHLKHHREQSEKQHARRIVDQFGLAAGEYERLLAIQGGGCGGCGRRPGKRRLAVDHDHSCCPGKTSCGQCVRGLLCWSCNKFLHHMRDDVHLIERLAAYLNHWPSRQLREAS